jgi:hypothetical protein
MDLAEQKIPGSPIFNTSLFKKGQFAKVKESSPLYEMN